MMMTSEPPTEQSVMAVIRKLGLPSVTTTTSYDRTGGTVSDEHVKKLVNEAVCVVENKVEGNIQSLDMKLINLDNAVLYLKSQIDSIQGEARQSKDRWEKIEAWIQAMSKDRVVFKGESSTPDLEKSPLLDTPKIPSKMVIEDDTPWGTKDRANRNGGDGDFDSPGNDVGIADEEGEIRCCK
ncbi:OLC1v1023576C1 [Oldenlandia corymbosa var. corymbosa]|uniref:OLC1v1023576C1 n=1 Tax=Oldenlandia corymbosa var. corymbosa TaxID=529605 RepID=A0AAV1C0Q6_OLDCO|nr:OLC1v1023576C1 [Oldenlandia corymbosa var. corymbosa]